jgi:hypothetical protein
MRRPKGYVGRDHETIGSDILAVLAILKMPEHVLGADEVKRLTAVDPAGWYPIEWLLDLMDRLDKQVGHYGLLRMGRMLFKLSHEDNLRAGGPRSARDLVYALDGMYHHANRGVGIGGWKVLKFEQGSAELEKTTPHHCVMEQGLLSAAFSAVGCPVMVSQRECFRTGASACLYTLSSTVTDETWSGIDAAGDRRAEKAGQRPI